MSKGHSQLRHQRGKKVREKCQAEASIEVIDVDDGEIDVVIIDEPESSRQGSKYSKEPGSSCYLDGVISIDDEEESSDEAPKNFHASAKDKVFYARSSDSSTSEESRSGHNLMSANEGNVRFTMHHTATNRFGLGSDSEDSISDSEFDDVNSEFSDSDTSDCEIMEDASGNIREEWERAARRKRASEKSKSHFGLEEQDSASESSGGQLLPKNGTQCKTDAKNCRSKYSFASSSTKNRGKESLSFGIPVASEFSIPRPQTESKSLSGEPGPSRASPYGGRSSQKSEHSPESYNGKAHSKDDTIVHDKLTGIERLKYMLLDPSFPLEVRLKFSFKDGGIFFVNNTLEVPIDVSLGTDGLHLKFGIDKVFADCSGRISSSNSTSAVAELIDLCSKIEAIISTDADPTTDIGYEGSNFQEDKVTVDGCKYRVQSPDEAFLDDKRAGTPNVEELKRPSCNLEEHSNINVKDAETSKSAAAEVNDSLMESKTNISGAERCAKSDIPHLEPGFHKEVHTLGACSYKSHSSNGAVDFSHAGSNIDEERQIVPDNSDLICERERHKESDEYKQADEEEWAARQRQLQIQAEEAQRLKKKRKAESLRLLDMERRQKERLNEIRESQKKGQETADLKEMLRAEVRKELDKVEHRYSDMASLLRGLGIPVGGGPYPLTREVNTAYKQALLKFHPDRASGSNIRQQVEAEETFKLITRLKEKLRF